jgi:hypothetical protein
LTTTKFPIGPPISDTPHLPLVMLQPQTELPRDKPIRDELSSTDIPTRLLPGGFSEDDKHTTDSLPKIVDAQEQVETEGHGLLGSPDSPENIAMAKNIHAVALGKRGGKARGGKGREGKMSAEERQRVARLGGRAMQEIWAKKRSHAPSPPATEPMKEAIADEPVAEGHEKEVITEGQPQTNAAADGGTNAPPSPTPDPEITESEQSALGGEKQELGQQASPPSTEDSVSQSEIKPPVSDKPAGGNGGS